MTIDSELEYQDVEVTKPRKLIANAMHTSLSEIPQLTLHSSFDASKVIAARKIYKELEKASQPHQPTINDFVLYSVSRVLGRHPLLNAHFLGDKIRKYSNVHLGLAIDTPRGLLVPTIFSANKKKLQEIAMESKSLAAAAQTGRIFPDLLTGATFTVTNLGALGIEMFTPIINSPQTGILGVDSLTDKIRIINGGIESYQSMGLSLTFDHRALDGNPAAVFLKDLCATLSSFTMND
jgi:pyruvate dehydrogenase E2 component (dihydrolipoamide acetyltransferase)